MRFTVQSRFCPVCGKDRQKGYHEPCSKKLQAASTAPKDRPGRLRKKPNRALNALADFVTNK